MSILNVNTIQPVGTGQTVTVSAGDLKIDTTRLRSDAVSGISITSNVVVSGIATVTSLASTGNVVVSGITTVTSLAATGNVVVSGIATVASLVETSSLTLKENISPIENALDQILQLNPVTYDRKNGLSKNEAGLIAEEVENVIPNIVTKDENGNPSGINYTKLSVYLIDAIKTLTKELKELKNGNS